VSRVIVIGLDSAPPELVFDEFAPLLPNLSKLRAEGASAPLRTIEPPITVPAWACMMTSRTPGQLGIYGFRNRKDHTYEGLSFATANAIKDKAVWDVAGDAGLKSVVVGVPPSYPTAPINGCRVGCFLTPSVENDFTWPRELKDELRREVGEYILDVTNFRSDDKERILRDIHALSARRFQYTEYLMATQEWDFLMMVDMGPDRIQHGFWKYMDPQHPKHEPGNPLKNAIRDYYVQVDQQVGHLLERAPDDAVVLVVSDHGAQRMHGGICLNEWLKQRGYLVLEEEPDGPTPFAKVKVDWSRTTAWGDGGYYGRLFLNVAGREPQGLIDPANYESVRGELIRELEALGDEQGRPIGTRVHRPEDLYGEVNGVAPDLIVYFGDLTWRSVGQMGTGEIHTFENDTGPDDANHARYGIFMQAGAPVGDLSSANVLDVGPTVLSLLGVDALPNAQGHPLA
jgi:predicted AlkP superfamily phosphohydrolase/phosphomutase